MEPHLFILQPVSIDMYSQLALDISFLLYIYIAAGMLKTVQWLLNSDISGNLITATDKNGDTPTHDAAEAGYVYISGSPDLFIEIFLFIKLYTCMT